METEATVDAADPTREHLGRGTRGAVYVEFILAFLPVFLMVLGMTQAALLYTGHLVVQHSAQCAARAAIVVLPDDPALYDGDAKYALTTPMPVHNIPSAIDAVVQFLSSRLGITVSIPGFGAGSGNPGSVYANANNRYIAIHDAASIPLLSISPSPDQVLSQFTSVERAIGDENPATRAVVGATIYNRAAMAVTFPDTPGALTYKTDYASDIHQTVTVRVTYAFNCAVPIARIFMCNAASEIISGSVNGQTQSQMQHGDTTGSTSAITGYINGTRLQREHPGVAELASAPLATLMASPVGPWATHRYYIMRSEASLPLQGADYSYVSEGGAASPGGSSGGGSSGGGTP